MEKILKKVDVGVLQLIACGWVAFFVAIGILWVLTGDVGGAVLIATVISFTSWGVYTHLTNN